MSLVQIYLIYLTAFNIEHLLNLLHKYIYIYYIDTKYIVHPHTVIHTLDLLYIHMQLSEIMYVKFF